MPDEVKAVVIFMAVFAGLTAFMALALYLREVCGG
jgi:hypothetical protein